MIRRILFWLCLFCCVPGTPFFKCLRGAVAFAQPLPERFPVTGRILDQANSPLAGAVVTIRRQDDGGVYAYWGGFAATDAGGYFKFPEAEEGRYYLNADLSGYGQILNQSVTWTLDSKPLTVQMLHLAELHLLITKTDGSPLSHSPLVVRLRGANGAGQSVRKVATDDTGLVTIPGLLPTSYAVYAEAPSLGYAAQNDLVLRYATSPAVYPLGLKPGGGLRLTVTEPSGGGAGGRPLGGATLLLNAGPGIEAFRSSDTVSDPGENIAALGVGGDRGGIASRDGDGIVNVMDLPPGHYNARVYLGSNTPVQREVTIAAGAISSLDIEFPSANSGAITFETQTRDGKPVADRDWSVRLMAMDGTTDGGPPGAPFGLGSSERRAHSDGTGRFTLYPLRPGRYRFWLTPRTAKEGAVAAVPAEGEVTPGGKTITVRFPNMPENPVAAAPVMVQPIEP